MRGSGELEGGGFGAALPLKQRGQGLSATPARSPHAGRAAPRLPPPGAVSSAPPRPLVARLRGRSSGWNRLEPAAGGGWAVAAARARRGSGARLPACRSASVGAAWLKAGHGSVRRKRGTGKVLPAAC